MDPADKKRIQRNFKKLVAALGTQAVAVSLLLLNEHRIITKRMQEDIAQAHPTDTTCAEALLSLIQTRGPHAYEALYKTVVASQLYGAADILRPENGSHWPKPEDSHGGSRSRDLQRAPGTAAAQVPERGTPPMAGFDPDMDGTDVIKGKLPRKNVNNVKPPPSDVSVDENDGSLSQTEVKQFDFVESAPRASDSPTPATQLSMSSETQVKGLVSLETEPKSPVSSTMRLREGITDNSRTQEKQLYPVESSASNVPTVARTTEGVSSKVKGKDSSEKMARQQESPTEAGREQKSNSRTSLLPTKWPKEDDFKNIVVKEVDSNSEMIKHYEESLRGQTYYTMKHATRGRAVIINNEDFLRMKFRKGTEKDSGALAVLFQSFGFKVQTYKNLKYQEILDSLDKETRLIKPSHDAFVLAILSHGCQGHVFGTDGYTKENQPHNAVELRQIRDTFCKVEDLVNKPKLFFIQACRGGEMDEGIQATNKPAAEQDDITLNDAKVAMEELKDEEPKEESDDGEKTPLHADCFFAMSTTAGFVSFRHVEYGSWFIQSVVYVLSNYAHQFDLGRLMTMVNELVSRNETQSGHKQVSEKKDTFRFLFCFFPGLNESTYQPVDRQL
ncbi:unnamed protein product [Lymnaea stagnalis]|uniref:Uncharacterized protein n=1 Tax=Lymnaea stagnalis TaxID=6523 RepID=A0AAV2H837_LYMST